MGDQHQTDLEQAKAKLQEVAETKESRKDNRQVTIVQPGVKRDRTDRVPDDERDIKVGTAKPKKKKFGQKLKEAMFSDDIGNGSVTEYVFFKILIPSTKRVLSDMANTAINMALGLDPKTRTIRSEGNTHTANARLYQGRQDSYRSGGYSVRKGILDDYEWDEETAKDYFNQMVEVADKYGDLSISNAYAICGLGHLIRMTDRSWGWTMAMLGRADVVPVDPAGERWVILMPEPRAL